MVHEPSEIFVGTSVSWTRPEDEYPSTTFVLRYTFINALNRYEVTASAGFSISISPVNFVPGSYEWVATVQEGANPPIVVDQGRILVRPALTAAVDIRTSTERALDAVTALLEGRASHDQAELQHNGRSLKRFDTEQLIKLKIYFSDLVRHERARAKGQTPNYLVQTRFE